MQQVNKIEGSSTRDIKVSLLNGFFSLKKIDLKLDKNNPACNPCLRISDAITYMGEQIDRCKSTSSSTLNNIRLAVNQLKPKLPPNLIDIDENFFSKNEKEINRLKNVYEELNGEYKKLLDSKADTLKKVIELPDPIKEEKAWQDRFQKVNFQISRLLVDQHQLESKLDATYSKAVKSFVTGRPSELPQSTEEQQQQIRLR